jgi:hypothetical protein
LHSEIVSFSDKTVAFKDGHKADFDAVVFCTGYFNAQGAIEAHFVTFSCSPASARLIFKQGKELAQECGERYEYGNGFSIDSEGESRVYYRPLAQKGLVHPQRRLRSIKLINSTAVLPLPSVQRQSLPQPAAGSSPESGGARH